MSTSKAMAQHSTQWLSQTNNYARPWLITTNSSSHQNNYSSILFMTAYLNIVQDNSSAIIQDYCSRRTIIQEKSKVHYYSTLFYFWRGSSPRSTRSFNNSWLPAEVINTRFNLYCSLVYI